MQDVVQTPPRANVSDEPIVVTPNVSDAAPHWSLAQRIAFRFAFAYFLLYNFPLGRVTLLSIVPWLGFLTQPYVRMWHAIVEWVATRFFHLSGPIAVYPAMNGSGDTTLDYIHNLCLVVFAAAATFVWSLLDRKRTNYRELHFWLRIYVRYMLAFTLFTYGFAKVFPLQFSSPGLSRLIEPLSDFSPMGLLWTFMGASMAYTIFSGAAELTGGLLLLFRRTTTLGALVSTAALVNVVLLNFCYDVPVKLFSSNLLVMAIFLLAPDLERLANFLVFNRAVNPVNTATPVRRRWLRMAMTVAKILVIGLVLVLHIQYGIMGYRARYITPVNPPLYGVYEVESFTRNGQEAPPLMTDASRWSRVVVQNGLTAKMMDGSFKTYGTEYNAPVNHVALFAPKDKNKKYAFAYSKPDADHVILQGKLLNDSLVIKLRRVDTKFLLVNRGFHWINERPFQR
ncbi:MAG: hypothetical protein ACR2NN_03565 [Bryobacteraceae bacterium]